jgi:hypothetical protein
MPTFCEVCEESAALITDSDCNLCLDCLVSGVEMGAI